MKKHDVIELTQITHFNVVYAAAWLYTRSERDYFCVKRFNKGAWYKVSVFDTVVGCGLNQLIDTVTAHAKLSVQGKRYEI